MWNSINCIFISLPVLTGFMTVAMALAHPHAIDGLISWQTAIRVLLWRGLWDMNAALTHLPLPPSHVEPPHPDRKWLFAPAFHCERQGSLLALQLQGCMHMLDWAVAIVCQAKGMSSGWGLKLILVGFIAPLWLLITGWGWVLIAPARAALSQCRTSLRWGLGIRF